MVLIIEVTDEFDQPGADGQIEVPNITAPAGDYHAVLVVGAATRATYGRCLLVRNSWGDWWGAGGYGWLPMAYLEAFAGEAGTVELP